MKTTTFTLKSAAAALLLSMASLSAQAALVFQYSITNTVGTVNGTVTGKIYGLSDNATGAATQVTIETFPAALDSIYAPGPIDVMAWDQQYLNSFTVTGGVITAASFWAQNTHNGMSQGSQLYINGSPFNFVNVDGDDTRYVYGSDGFGGVTFTAVDAAAVPEPASLTLVGLGLAGLASLRRRKAS